MTSNSHVQGGEECECLGCGFRRVAGEWAPAVASGKIAGSVLVGSTAHQQRFQSHPNAQGREKVRLRNRAVHGSPRAFSRSPAPRQGLALEGQAVKAVTIRVYSKAGLCTSASGEVSSGRTDWQHQSRQRGSWKFCLVQSCHGIILHVPSRSPFIAAMAACYLQTDISVEERWMRARPAGSASTGARLRLLKSTSALRSASPGASRGWTKAWSRMPLRAPPPPRPPRRLPRRREQHSAAAPRGPSSSRDAPSPSVGTRAGGTAEPLHPSTASVPPQRRVTLAGAAPGGLSVSEEQIGQLACEARQAVLADHQAAWRQQAASCWRDETGCAQK